MKTHIVQLLLICSTGLRLLGSEAIEPHETIHLLNGNNLSQFDAWIAGQGLNNDTNKVFQFVDRIDGVPALRVSGQGYGGLITKQAFKNYRLVAEYRWGLGTWLNRTNAARDNGFLLHCQGEPGNYHKDFTGPWMASVEFQIIEGGVGDLLLVPGYRRDGSVIKPTVRVRYHEANGQRVFDPATELRTGEAFTRVNWPGRNPCWRDILGFRGQFDVDSPPGQWTRIEAEVREGNFAYRVNGKLVNEAQECNYTEGRILLQTEAAEIYFRKVDLEPLGER